MKTPTLEETLRAFDNALLEVQEARNKKDWVAIHEKVKALERIAFRLYMMTDEGV